MTVNSSRTVHPFVQPLKGELIDLSKCPRHKKADADAATETCKRADCGQNEHAVLAPKALPTGRQRIDRLSATFIATFHFVSYVNSSRTVHSLHKGHAREKKNTARAAVLRVRASKLIMAAAKLHNLHKTASCGALEPLERAFGLKLRQNDI